MKPFSKGTKVEVLWSANDESPDWAKATVVGTVSPNMKGIEQHGNIVKIDGTVRQVIVTEPGMIRPLNV